MAKKRIKKTNAKVGTENKNTSFNPQESEQIAKEIAKLSTLKGEVLCNKIVRLLVEYGSDPVGLTIETYAMTKALAMLLKMAETKQFKAIELMDMLAPSITREVDDIWELSGTLETDE